MRAFTKSAVVAVAATVACTLPLGVAAAQTSPFGSLGSLGSTSPETPAPQVTASKTTGIAAAGETITVAGTGFSGAGAGIYVGLVQDDKFSVTDPAAWMTTKWLESTDIVGGSWSAAIDVAAVKNGSDCLVNTCSIYTIAAHGSTDRSQDTQTPITFAAPAGPAVTVSKTTGLTNDEEITVTGTNFSANGQGIYVALAQVDKYSNTNSAVFHSTKWIKPAGIVGGAFTTTLKATAIKGDANCYVNACAIYTLADHNTLSDRSQDTQTPITFAPKPTVTANKTTGLAVGDTITVSGTGLPSPPAWR